MRPERCPGALELWGGLECTVNRVDERYFDQVERTGHHARASDLELFADLGIRALRYPVLWERVAPGGPASADWRWPDERLDRLRRLGIEPILGLLHHGSGPPGTDLLDPRFPDLLADYAGAVARRYPWATSYTPVNEPLTTARFSALYGLWYPHARDPRLFARALLNQLRGVVLAMARIREVNPEARLVQTEDLGKVFSTPRLAYQAEFENHRRWLTFDLLTGRVKRGHPMWTYLVEGTGLERGALEWFADHPTPPDILGINYYLTSERLLDERLERYPASTHGGNGRDRYADVEAVRVRTEGVAGPRTILSEAWERYRRPLAVTEAHNGCTREEQMRWFLEVWTAAAELRKEGADLRAVTAWSLLGAYDWNSLVTVSAGHYEPGVFDLRAPTPRPTGLVPMLRALAAGSDPDHPVLDSPGWWRRSRRFAYGVRPLRPSTPPTAVRPLLITGATGTLGRELARRADVRGLEHRLTGRAELDIADPSAVAETLDRLRPWALVNAAGYVRVDDAEADQARCFRENAEGSRVLA
ncbi:MAG TPA: family 1 glycosylhydrolase, partial [Gemmatimonadales bacterium]|nr:family 1 glycosylhydrolase [Gemmatimonadales bacterium]